MSHLHVIIQVLISTSCMLNFSQQEMFLGLTSPAGNAPGGGWSGWAHPYSAFSPLPRSLGWLSETVPSLPLFPPISAQPLMTTFLLSTPPPPTPTPSSTPNLGNGWGLPGQDPGELQTHPASLEMQPLLGVVFLLDGAPGQGFRCPSPSVSPAYQRYRTGVSLALHFQVLSLDVGPRKQCYFMIKESPTLFGLFVPCPLLFVLYCFTLPQFP